MLEGLKYIPCNSFTTKISKLGWLECFAVSQDSKKGYLKCLLYKGKKEWISPFTSVCNPDHQKEEKRR